MLHGSNGECEEFIHWNFNINDSKVKSYNFQPLWSKRSTVLYPEMVFHHPGGEQREEGGTK